MRLWGFGDNWGYDYNPITNPQVIEDTDQIFALGLGVVVCLTLRIGESHHSHLPMCGFDPIVRSASPPVSVTIVAWQPSSALNMPGAGSTLKA